MPLQLLPQTSLKLSHFHNWELYVDRSSGFDLRIPSRYALAVGATLIAFAVTYALKREPPSPVFLFFILAVVVSVWYGGRGPSVVAIVLSLLLTKYFFRPPIASILINRAADVVPFVAFATVAVAIIGIVEALKNARALAESHSAELERVNEELRHALASRRLLAAQEIERRRISRVLHEDVGQLLTAVSLNLHRVTTSDDGNGSLIGDTSALVDEALTHVRNLSVELRPTVLDDLGLGHAVAWYADRQAQRAGFAVAVENESGDGRLPEPVETAGFRIVQEALTNVARHGRATNVRIALRRNSRGLAIEVADNGTGFDVQSAKARAQAGESLGLVDMTELAYMAGGVLTITSTLGKGSAVHVQFPPETLE